MALFGSFGTKIIYIWFDIFYRVGLVLVVGDIDGIIIGLYAGKTYVF